jgi:hypothetical protein
MAGVVEGYDKFKHRGQADHNFDNIVKTLEQRFTAPKIRGNLSLRFVGYLMLDELWAKTFAKAAEDWRAARYGTVGTRRPAPFLLLLGKAGMA